MNRIKPPYLSRKRAITTFLSQKFMITRSSIAFEDFLGSSIAPQVMPPWSQLAQYLTFDKTFITAPSPTVQIQQQNKTFCAIFNETKYIWFKAFQISLLTIKGQLTESHFCLIFQTPQTMIRHFFAFMLPETFFKLSILQCSLKLGKETIPILP